MKGKIIFLGIDVGLAIVVGIFAIICIGFIGLLNGNAFEGIGGEEGGGGSGYDCAGVADVPADYYQWVKDAANLRLGGDEAALVALIQIESGWDPTIMNDPSDTSKAAGLGQFLLSTAEGGGYPEFTGGTDDVGKSWPPADPVTSRLDPERAIYATAHKLGLHLKDSGGDLKTAYVEGYHSYCRDLSQPKCVNQKNASEAAGNRLMDKYNEIINGGGCKLKGTTACGVTPISETDAVVTAKHHELMPPAADSFNQIAAEYHQKTGKKLGVTSTFRTHDEQETLHEQKPNLANEPGKSMHEAGLAIDIDWKAMSQSEYSTFLDIASKNQWEVASHGGYGSAECWHFDYAALKSQYWYDEPKISNAIAAANSCGGSETTMINLVHKISIYYLVGGLK